MEKAAQMYSCEIIINGVLPTLKYYLRLVDDPAEFLEIYSNNLKKDYERNTDLKKPHLEIWDNILQSLPQDLS